MSHPEDPHSDFETIFTEAIDNLPILIKEGFFDTPCSLDPESLGISDQPFELFSTKEQKTMQKILFEKLGIASPQKNLVRNYGTTAPPDSASPGTIQISVFSTNIPGMFLQELHYSDNKTFWAFGPNQDI